jgi:hypothetical protein
VRINSIGKMHRRRWMNAGVPRHGFPAAPRNVAGQTLLKYYPAMQTGLLTDGHRWSKNRAWETNLRDLALSGWNREADDHNDRWEHD